MAGSQFEGCNVGFELWERYWGGYLGGEIVGDTSWMRDDFVIGA